MKRVNVSFSADEGRHDIGVLFMASERDEQVDALMSRIEDPLADVLTVYDAEGAAVSLAESRIVSISVDNKKLRVIAENGIFQVKMSMQDIEAQLNPNAFLRVSRFDIINLARVQRFDFSMSGTLRIEMEQGLEVWASRRYIPAIKKRLQRKGQ